MNNGKLLVTMKDIQRHKVFKDIIDKRLTGIQAAQILNLTPVHVSRLKKRLIEGGFEAILRKAPQHPPNQKIPSAHIQKILALRKKIYYDFNIMHFMDKLHDIHKLPYSYESIRKILISKGLHNPKKKKKIHRMRRRMPKSGLLVQMDSSQHFWLPLIENKWWLIAMIDDATNEIPYAQFFPKDTLFANMAVIKRFIEIKGIFYSLYVDKASHFKTTRHGGIHYNISGEYDDTQIERALSKLGINLIPANSPQAKGRIEVTFRLFQDRLIKEMRLANIKNYTQANKFLIENFLPWYNSKYTHPADSAYMPLAKGIDLDLVFSIKKERTVNNDNVVQAYSQYIQIPPSKLRSSFAKLKVDTCLLEDNRIFILYKNKIIAQSMLSENNKFLKKEKIVEKLLNHREYNPLIIKHKKHYNKNSIPTKDHPWRRPFVLNISKL